MKIFYSLTGSAFLACTLLLSACGGSGGNDPGPDPIAVTMLSGTAAAGAAVIGQVTVKGSLGSTKSALIEADGSYSVDVSGLTAPYRLRAQGTVGGRTIKLFSYAEAADVNGTVNITPFTDLIVANAAQQIAESFFESYTTTTLDPILVEEQETALQAKLQDVFTAMGVDTAVDLLRTSFSADHSGLDAALDAIRVQVNTTSNIATITNLVENTTISDNLTDTTDNSATLTVTDPNALTTSADAIQAINARFSSFSQAFANGVPAESAIAELFASDFLQGDQVKSVFLSEITSDPTLAGLSFSGISVSDLDLNSGTATVTFNVTINGSVEPDPEVWTVAFDNTLGWQLRGDQRIADVYFDFHCNDNDGTDTQTGGCGINTQTSDNDFSNNGTGDAPIASARVSLIDGSDGVTVKATILLGTPATSAPGEVQVYNPAIQDYQGDYMAFGSGVGEVDSSLFLVGDIIQYELFTTDLDISTPTTPAIASAAVAVATYQDTLLFAPATIGMYPQATSSTLSAINNFTLGNNLVISWTRATGTLSDEVLIQISDSQGNRIEVWDESFLPTASTTTIASSAIDSTATTNAGLDPNNSPYTLLVRIYTRDELTGQAHSTDYTSTFDPNATSSGGTGGGSGLTCYHESGWNDNADGGLGAPINPNSFSEYEDVVADCATALSFTAADVAGKTFQEKGFPDIMTFNSGTGTAANPATGTYAANDGSGETLTFQWWVEAATCTGCTHSYLVLYSDTTIDANLPISFVRDTAALISYTGTLGAANSEYSYIKYSEQANYSDSDRASGSDGEIWNSVDVILP